MTPLLAERTTLGVGGPPDTWVTATTRDDVVQAVTSCDQRGTPVLVLGGGSNVLVADEGFRGTVVQMATRGTAFNVRDGFVTVEAEAGETWDALVERCVAAGWSGIEALSGIPGLVGATPVQNVGAYGQDVSQTIYQVTVLDRRTGAVRTLAHSECGFGYRTSRFKATPERWVVLAVVFRLSSVGIGELRYAELARHLAVDVGDLMPVGQIREAVLRLRRAKGMVLDPADCDTRSVGSFFMNPVVDPEFADRIDAQCPRYPADDGAKLSAAWLIENAGIPRGYRVRPDARAAVSTKHTLALTNTGGATAADVLDLARAIRERVEDAFGITLRPEARLVNCAL